MNALRVEALDVRYGPVHAVRGVGLNLPPGSFVSVTGPSGAGKSSLLWALAGALRPSAGRVTLGDAVVSTRQQAARLGIALVPQGNALATALTASENLFVPLLAAGLASAEARRRTQEALVRVGLDESGDHLVEELSGGQQQRVALARALAGGAHVLLADEPTSDLDAGNRERVIEALREEAERGAIVVMSTHDPEAAEQTDGELALDEGTATWRRSPATVETREGWHPS